MRARNIKPGFFQNDELASCTLAARLLFIGIWTLADREGRLEDRPGKIKFQLLPTDQFNAEEAIDELVSHGFLLRYEANGQRYIQVVNWSKHQNPHIKEAASTIPAPDEHGTSTVRTPDQPGLIPRFLDSIDLPPTTAREEEPDAEAVEVEMTDAERMVVVFAKRVPGMASVDDAAIAMHVRECNDIHGPFPEQFVIAQMQQWAGHWSEKRARSPGKWRSWRTSISRWFGVMRRIYDDEQQRKAPTAHRNGHAAGRYADPAAEQPAPSEFRPRQPRVAV